jgi:hypothetical protein
MQSLMALPAFGRAPVPNPIRYEKTKAAFPAGGSLESKLLCLQSSLFSLNFRFWGIVETNESSFQFPVSSF